MIKWAVVALIGLGGFTQNVQAVDMRFQGMLREDVPCEVNAGKKIEIDFESVGVNKIDGERFKKTFAITVSCPTGFSVPFKILYVGPRSSFDAVALATSVSGLGIKARQQVSGVFVDLAVGGYIAGVAGLTQQLQVVPVRDPKAVLEPGVFSANATFKFEYY